MGLRLGIDFGTSSTVAVLEPAGGQVRPLLFGETPVLPSAVCMGSSGELLVGRDALHAARVRPEAFEPNPKRRIDDGSVLLGEFEVPVPELIGAVLRRVLDEAARAAGEPISATTLTHPAGWGPRRSAVLMRAAEVARLPEVTLVAEPVAAGTYFVSTLGNVVPSGRCLAVYDFGAGTFDASVLRSTGSGFEVLSAEGLLDAGGLDIDASVFAYLGAVHGAAHPDVWGRLTAPAGAPDRRAARLLWDDIRAGKEMLSRASSTTVHVPLLETEAIFGREQLESLARPLLERTVAATRTALRTAGVEPGDLAGIFLVGGSSRMPLCATLLHRALGIAPVVIEQPELVVANGSLQTVPTPVAVVPAPALDVVPVPVAVGVPAEVAAPVATRGPAEAEAVAPAPVAAAAPVEIRQGGWHLPIAVLYLLGSAGLAIGLATYTGQNLWGNGGAIVWLFVALAMLASAVSWVGRLSTRWRVRVDDEGLTVTVNDPGGPDILRGMGPVAAGALAFGLGSAWFGKGDHTADTQSVTLLLFGIALLVLGVSLMARRRGRHFAWRELAADGERRTVVGRYRWPDIEDARLEQPGFYRVLFVGTAEGKGPVPNALCRFDENRRAIAAVEAGAGGLPLAALTAAIATHRA